MADVRQFQGAAIAVAGNGGSARSQNAAVIVLASETPPPAAGVRTIAAPAVIPTFGDRDARLFSTAVIIVHADFEIPFRARRETLVIGPQSFPLFIGKVPRK